MNKRLTTACLTVMCLATPAVSSAAASPEAAAQAVNALGLDLMATGTAANRNALLSPYSIQTALAMTYAGAAGDTRSEMARVLHYPADEAVLHQAFGAMAQALDEVAKTTAQQAENARKFGGAAEPVVLTVANRLFGQQGYEFRQPFLELVKGSYGAPLQAMDFVANAEQQRLAINAWVEEQTRQRIRDLIPAAGLNRETRLVLVNAIYMKAPWSEPFRDNSTQPQPFAVNGAAAQKVPTMHRLGNMGYAKRDSYQVITVPYTGGGLHLLVLLPDAKDGLAALEAKLTPEILCGCAKPGAAELDLYLPKFKLEPPVFKMGEVLRTLGMRTAFDVPPGSANFDRMAPRKPNDYLHVSEVFHKTFLALDEKGTEAAAATAVAMARATAIIEDKPKPIEVRVDRPFLFAIQHVSSGACLFLGRVTDPR